MAVNLKIDGSIDEGAITTLLSKGSAVLKIISEQKLHPIGIGYLWETKVVDLKLKEFEREPGIEIGDSVDEEEKKEILLMHNEMVEKYRKILDKS
jgi:hypothetical protein